MNKPTLYQVINWNDHYENAKSRTIEHKTWCAVPNKQDGLGLARLLREKDGPAIYGAFVATILMLSRQGLPREGYLTDTGLIDGMILTPEDISLVIRMPADLVRRMLAHVSSVNVGWLRVCDMEDTPGIPRGYHEDTVGPPKKDGIGLEGLEGQDVVVSLPCSMDVYEKHPRLKLIHGCLMLRGVTLEIWLRCKRNRSPELDWDDAVEYVLGKAELQTDITKPGAFVDYHLSQYEKKHIQVDDVPSIEETAREMRELERAKRKRKR